MPMHQQIAPAVSSTSSAIARAPILRRKCACGASATSGTCEDCRRPKLQAKLVVGSAFDSEEREADRVADVVMGTASTTLPAATPTPPSIQRAGDGAAGRSSTGSGAAPAIVNQVLSRSGQPLESGARHFMEQRFGRDFGNVRVHTDSEAATSASAVDAHAYTVGNHVVFASSRYAPQSASGRRLLAHELTHVVQQGGTLRRHAATAEITGQGEREEDEAKQPVQRLQRHPAIVGLDEAGPDADLTGKKETEMWRLAERDKKLAECKKAAGPDPEACDPKTPPGWGSFSGSAVATSPFGAATASSIKRVDVPSQQCEETITGSASGPKKIFQGKLDPAASWVKQKFLDAGDPTKNGSAVQVTACQTFFNGLGPGGTGSWGLNTGASAVCPASARPRGDKATKLSECATVIEKDFTDASVAESNRLLRHEQIHLALSCAMAKKANKLVAAGTKTFAQIDATIDSKLATAQSQYDGQSQHGCIAGQQAAWETKIANELPAVTLP